MKQIVEDKSQLILTILALMVSMLSIGLYMEMRSSLERERRLQEQLVDAKVQAGIERARADMQQQAAESNATAKVARTDAAVALDKLEDLRTQLAAKGIKVELDGH